MKVNSLLIKTALAAAVASVSFAASAATLQLTVTAPTTLANEIFGTGSETTIIQLPTIEFDATAAGDLSGVTVDATGKSTIKLTLGGNAVFGEVYDDPANWATQNIKINVGATPVLLDENNATVSAGGTKNDNQITITLSNGDATLTPATLDTVTISGLKVQQVKSSLERSGSRNVRTVTASLEVRADATDSTSEIDNAGPNVVIQSIDGVILGATPTNYTGGLLERKRINVADNDLLFTIPGGSAASGPDSFQSPGVNTLNLGTVTVNRNTQGYQTGFARPAGKEDGTLFDFTGGDTVTLSLSSEGGIDLRPYGSFYLQDVLTATDICDGSAKVGLVGGNDVVASATNPGTVAFQFANTAILGKDLQLCAVKPNTNTDALPEVVLAGELNVDYFSARYTDSYDRVALGPVLRNGCAVTLFNLPNVNAADNAFIRFTNTSGTLGGKVYASVWSEDGQMIERSAEVLDNLDAHATTVFHTNQGQASGVYLGDVLPSFAESAGRSRIVLQGAFDSCEALGLVRSANGTLVNMTSTTYSTTAGNPNGTSNTGN